MRILGDRAQLALDTIMQKPVKGIPNWLFHPMEHSMIERVAGAQPGDYKKEPEKTYLAMQNAVGVCFIDQYIPENALTMEDKGFEGTERKATTGASVIICDGILIDSPEAVVQHMEEFIFPSLRKETEEFDEDAYTGKIIEGENAVQDILAPDILKTGYSFISFPRFAYGTYGYEQYFMAYALYPEVIEKHFSLQADLALRKNRAAAKAYTEANLPPLFRLDHDMAYSRGTLVNIQSLDKIWFPHFARCLDPMLKTDVKMIWHCDGNLMEMVPRLLEVGLRGFQGFQYEDGMDYEKICRMKTKDGDSLLIIGGVSVTRTLPHGTPDDVKKELSWLVENGPKTGLLLACSSAITPGVIWENLHTLIEGYKYYRTHGRE